MKENHKFDELISLATKAVRDGLLQSFKFEKSVLNNDIIILISNYGVVTKFAFNRVENGINFIKSFYAQTFTIKSLIDIQKIKVGAKIIFANGAVAIFEGAPPSFAFINIKFEGSIVSSKAPHELVISATVKQEIEKPEYSLFTKGE